MDYEGQLQPTAIEKAEHIEVNGVPAKRVLIAGWDGTNLQDLNVDASGNLPQLNQIHNAIAAIRSTIGIASDLRVSVVSTIAAVSTVSSVTNVAAIGAVPGLPPMNALMNLAYIQSNGNNIARGEYGIH